MSKVASGYTEIVLDIKEKGASQVAEKLRKIDGFIRQIEKDNKINFIFDSKKIRYPNVNELIDQMDKQTKENFIKLNTAYFNALKADQENLYKLQGNTRNKTWKAKTAGYKDDEGVYHEGETIPDKKRKIKKIEADIKDMEYSYVETDKNGAKINHKGIDEYRLEGFARAQKEFGKLYKTYKDFEHAGYDKTKDGMERFARTYNLDYEKLSEDELRREFDKTKYLYSSVLKEGINLLQSYSNTKTQFKDSQTIYDEQEKDSVSGRTLIGESLQKKINGVLNNSNLKIDDDFKAGLDDTVSDYLSNMRKAFFADDDFVQLNKEYSKQKNLLNVEKRALEGLEQNQKEINDYRDYQFTYKKPEIESDINESTENKPKKDVIQTDTVQKDTTGEFDGDQNIDIKVRFVPTLDELKTELLSLVNGEYSINIGIEDFESKFIKEHEIVLEYGESLNNLKSALDGVLNPYKLDFQAELDKKNENKTATSGEKNKKRKSNKDMDLDDEEDTSITIQEGLEIKDRVIKAFNNSGYDVNSFKVLENGAVELSVKYKETGEKISKINSKLSDLENALDGETFREGFLEEQSGVITTIYNKRKKTNSHNEEPQKITLKEGQNIEARFKNAFEKSNMDIGTFKVLSNGMVELSGRIRETGKEFSNVKLKISDVDKILTKDNTFKRGFLNNLSGDITTKYNGRINKDAYIDKLMSIAKKSRMNISKDSIKVFDDGSMSFIHNKKDIKTGVTNRVRYNIKDIENEENYNEYFTKNGTFRKSFLKSYSGVDDIIEQTRKLENLLNLYDQVNQKALRMDKATPGNRDNKIYSQLNDARKNIEDYMNEQMFTKKEKDSVYKRMENFNKHAKVDKVLKDGDKDKILSEISQLEYIKNNRELFSNKGNIFIKDEEVANASELNSYLNSIFDKINLIKTSIEKDQILDENDLIDKLNSLKSYSDKIFTALKINDGSQSYGKISIPTSKTDDIKQAIHNRLKAFGYQEINFGKFNKDNGLFNVSYKDTDGNLVKSTMQIEQYTESVKEATNANEKFKTSLRLVEHDRSTNTPITKGQQWIESWKAKFKSLTQYISGIEIVSRAWREIQEGFAFVQNLDSLMTTIYQTSDLTNSDFGKLKQGAIDSAKELGTNVDQVSGAIEVYTAYGETVDSLLKKSAPTTMLAKAADVDVKVASDQIQGV